MKKLDGGITAVKGFSAAGLHSGIKPRGQLDLALIFSDIPSTAAGVFTRNRFQAAPLKVTQEHLARGNRLQAIVVTSGNANALTGKKGIKDAHLMALSTAQSLHIKKQLVGLASTGVIGEPLPMKRILSKIPKVTRLLSPKGGTNAARAMLTTDTTIKETAYRMKLKNKVITVGGAAKGSGMIHPQMATMLGFLSTDVRISHGTLKRALLQAVDSSFNAISVDGCTSTNDMVLCMANGKTSSAVIPSSGPLFQKFCFLLQKVCTELADKIVSDGEGATKFVEIKILGAPSLPAAKKVGTAVALSPLVKTALYGEDGNWGRIMAAVGSCGVRVSEEKVDLFFGNNQLIKQGKPNPRISESSITRYLKRKKIGLTLNLHGGKKEWLIRTCDLSFDYIKINASYRS